MIAIRATALLACAFAFAAFAGSTQETRAVAGLHAISMGIAMDLDVIQDGTESLTLEGDPEVLAKIDTSVWNGTLEFQYKPHTRVDSHRRVHGVVHARRVDAIALSGSGNVRAPSLEADSLALSISGSGDLGVERLAAKRASLSISGSGNVSVAGKADDLEVRISGSGAVKAARLEAQRAQVNIAGSGNATVWAKQQLAAAISGVGNVRYYGDPQLARAIRGVGHIERIAANP